MTSSHRRAYVDWARGIAVLLMIEAHTVDAWTRSADRHSVMFRDAIVLGGFAAPLFLQPYEMMIEPEVVAPPDTSRQ